MFSIFKKYPHLILAISEKKNGSMRIGTERDNLALKNRERFLKKINVDPRDTVNPILAHDTRIKIVKNEDRGKIIKGVDGLITKEKNLFLTITVADCLPIFIFDAKNEVVGLVHAGWKGLTKSILEKAIKKFVRNFQSNPKEILVGIGPAICQAHYEVKKDLTREFKSFPTAFLKKEGKIFLDLKKVAEIQLLNLGIKKENIEINLECTFCLRKKYFSFRREKSQNIKAMLVVFGIKS